MNLIIISFTNAPKLSFTQKSTEMSSHCTIERLSETSAVLRKFPYTIGEGLCNYIVFEFITNSSLFQYLGILILHSRSIDDKCRCRAIGDRPFSI